MVLLTQYRRHNNEDYEGVSETCKKTITDYICTQRGATQNYSYEMVIILFNTHQMLGRCLVVSSLGVI